MVELGGGKIDMASSSTSNCSTLPPKTAPLSYFLYPTPLATYQEVVASPVKFKDTLEKLHAAMGTKFMVPTVGGRELDLHRLFVEVTYRGGLVKTVQEKKWKDVTAVFSFPQSATNASFVLRKYYHSLLIHYEQIYFFRALGWNPETINAMQQTSSRIPAPFHHGSSDPLISSPTSNQAAGVNTAKSSRRACSSSPSLGYPVNGVIDGEFENGYLVTVKIGSEEFRGVLYHTTVEPPNHKDEQNPPQQCQQPVSVNNNGNSDASSSKKARRKRRKKSEIKRRDPAHPKPNRSGYNFFFADQHARLKPLHPGKDREISKMIGELWNKVNETEKSVYQEKAAKDKERYRMEMERYRERLRTGQMMMISNAVPIQQLPPIEPSSINEDANANNESAMPMQPAGDAKMIDLEKECQTDDENPPTKTLDINLNASSSGMSLDYETHNDTMDQNMELQPIVPEIEDKNNSKDIQKSG